MVEAEEQQQDLRMAAYPFLILLGEFAAAMPPFVAAWISVVDVLPSALETAGKWIVTAAGSGSLVVRASPLLVAEVARHCFAAAIL